MLTKIVYKPHNIFKTQKGFSLKIIDNSPNYMLMSKKLK